MLIKRIKTRLADENVNEELIKEFLNSAKERLCLKLDEEEVPESFEIVIIEIVIKWYRTVYYEGIKKESIAENSIEFITNIFSEYEYEINNFIKNKQEQNGKGVIRFI